MPLIPTYDRQDVFKVLGLYMTGLPESNAPASYIFSVLPAHFELSALQMTDIITSTVTN